MVSYTFLLSLGMGLLFVPWRFWARMVSIKQCPVGLLRWHSVCNGFSCQCRRCRRRGLHPWVRKIPWSRKWQPAPVFLPGKSHGHRNPEGYSPWGHKELDVRACMCVHAHICKHTHTDMVGNKAQSWEWRKYSWKHQPSTDTMGPQEINYEHLLRNTWLLRTSITNVNEAMLKRSLDLIDLLIFSQLGLLAWSWWAIFLTKVWRWSDISLTR